MRKKKRIYMLLLYMLSYLFIFFCLEQLNRDTHILHTRWDDKIPFCRYYIIPYILWYPFFGFTVFYFACFEKQKKEYIQLMQAITFGLMGFVITSIVYPNAQDLRPDLSGKDFWEKVVLFLYKIDTPTNILPSLHVYNAVACSTAYWVSKSFGKCIKYGTAVLTVCIIFSTLFLKQHSVIDVCAALFLYIICYIFIYKYRKAEIKLTDEE